MGIGPWDFRSPAATTSPAEGRGENAHSHSRISTFQWAVGGAFQYHFAS